MDFLTQYPLFRFLYWLINSPGIGGLIAIGLGSGSALAALLTLRWIKQGADAPEPETYAYPTPSLLGHGQE